MSLKFVYKFTNIPKKKLSLKSNLQKSILSFYREVLKFSYKKSEVNKNWNPLKQIF